jgi:MoaA/NifB/PqqE/SkfB family radical SAM enzyme
MLPKPLKFETDPKFEEHFSKLRQVFLYLTDECQLRCAQCYYKPWLKNYPREIPLDVAVTLLGMLREKGAIKLSLLGGEPTLYDRQNNNLALNLIIRYARALGYQYIRLVTNGQFDSSLLQNPTFRLLDEITFSIDGHTEKIHENMRGRGTFAKAVRNLKIAVGEGYKVHITTCVHKGNVERNRKNNTYLLEEAIIWASNLGAHLINFHPVIKMGIPRDTWINDTDILPEQWLELYDYITALVFSGTFKIKVRIPQRYVHLSEYLKHPGNFEYCPLKMAERVEVHPNGQIHSCALNNGTPICLARFGIENEIMRLKWEKNTNEIDYYPIGGRKFRVCPIMKDSYPLVPLCISYKPCQEEFIWNSLGYS